MKLLRYRPNKTTKLAISAVVLVVLWFIYQQQAPLPASITSADVAQEIAGLTQDAPLELITLPDAGVGVVRELIQNAKQSVHLAIYQLTDTNIQGDLVNALAREVSVKVILNEKGPFGRRVNDETYEFLRLHGVAVAWSPDYFPYFHQKTLIIDHSQALIMTFNLVPKYYATGRDFAVLNKDIDDVSAIEEAFENDFAHYKYPARSANNLVWSPGSDQVMLGLIDGAQISLDVYNEEMADSRITNALKNASLRGVDVKIVMTYATNWKPAFNDLVGAGATVRTFASTAKTYIHAKMILADDKTAFVGSENFSYTSLEANRELGILTVNPEIISSLQDTFTKDFNSARVYVPK